MIKNSFSKSLSILVFLVAYGISNASAQLTEITFTRPATSDSMVTELGFGFNIPDDADAVEIDQLGSFTALFQTNDQTSLELFLDNDGPISSIGEVDLGDSITPGDTFAISSGGSLNIGNLIAAGEDFFLGFSSFEGAVGFFNVSRPAGTDEIVYSGGWFAPDTTVIVAVPEPSSITLILLGCVAPLVRRRRAV